MEAHASLRRGAADQLRLLVRIVVSSPVLLLILLVAVSAAAEPSTPEESPALAAAPRALALAAPETAGTRILGFDVFAMTGSLADERQHRNSAYARPWGRGPHDFGERALGLAWGWRF